MYNFLINESLNISFNRLQANATYSTLFMEPHVVGDVRKVGLDEFLTTSARFRMMNVTKVIIPLFIVLKVNLFRI